MNSQSLVSAVLGLIPWRLRLQIRKLPVIAPLQRYLVARFLEGREFSHRVSAGPAKGIYFRLMLPEDKGIWTGTYETGFAARLAAEVRPGSVTYDIGSWHGFFAGVMAAQGAAIVHVFEPLPANAERISQLIALNPGRRIILHQCALGDRETGMDLVVMPESSMAKLEQSEFQSGAASTRRVPVRVRSLDIMVASGEIEPPGLIKIDVEGAEMMVLEGARETLKRHRPQIFAEVHSSALLAQCTQFLQSEAYTIESLDHDLAAARSRDVFQLRAFVPLES